MARRQMFAKKQKTIRVSKTEAYLINYKHMGDEPLIEGTPSTSEYAKAINWYNTMASTDDARSYLDDYLTMMDRQDEAKQLRNVPDIWVSTTAAWIARLITRGTDIEEHSLIFLESKIIEMMGRIKEADETVSVDTRTVRDKMRERSSDILGEIEGFIDDYMINGVEGFSLYDWLKRNEIPASYMPAIVARYTPWLEELLVTADGENLDLMEAYINLGPDDLLARIEFLNMIIEDADRYGSITKKVRAPRKPRPVSVEKKLKNFKYQKEDNTYRVASIKPDKIIGAQELWTFNTKYKVLSVLRASDRTGLDVKGTSITGYDDATSMSRGCGRKAEDVINQAVAGGKLVLRKLMTELKTEKQLQYRINENTILLRVVT